MTLSSPLGRFFFFIKKSPRAERRKIMKKIVMFFEDEEDDVCGTSRHHELQEITLAPGETPEEALQNYVEQQYKYLCSVWEYNDAPILGDFYTATGKYLLRVEYAGVREVEDN